MSFNNTVVRPGTARLVRGQLSSGLGQSLPAAPIVPIGSVRVDRTEHGSRREIVRPVAMGTSAMTPAP